VETQWQNTTSSDKKKGGETTSKVNRPSQKEFNRN